MAKKVILLKLLQELRAYESVPNRRPAPAAPLLSLMQLRQRNGRGQVRSRQPAPRLAITTQWQNAGEAPASIKINHTVEGHGELPVVLG